jgi:hypothetical protein
MIQKDQPRQEIRSRLEAARAYVSAFTGLYSDEDLAQEVLAACDGWWFSLGHLLVFTSSGGLLRLAAGGLPR